MSNVLAYEKNTDLAFDTEAFIAYGKQYAEVATTLREMATDLDDCLRTLTKSGWQTPAGTAFYEMTDTNWKENIDKYADLLDTLNEILQDAAAQYNDLVKDYIETTKV